MLTNEMSFLLLASFSMAKFDLAESFVDRGGRGVIDKTTVVQTERYHI